MPASVENLALVWASIDQLCSGLPDGRWERPTGCPGWTVKDHLSHLVDYEARALGQPPPEHEPGRLPHVKNEMGRANEVGVDLRRPRPGAQVLGEFREVTGERLAQLRDLTGPDLTAAVTTFAALAGGRSDVPDDVDISGDRRLGQRVLASMGIMP